MTNFSRAVSDAPTRTPGDLEIKDAQLIFSAVWDALVEKHGRENLRFPRDFIWLGGAPGSGKGTNTPFIAATRDISEPPIVVSDLLTTPQAVAIKNAGKMVGDREVIGLLLEQLLQPVYQDGVIVDGFPRTIVQAETLKLFFNALLKLHDDFRNSPLSRYFRKPMFRIALLFVSEEISVERQLRRGHEIQQHNRLVRESGVGELKEERVTDVDPELCRNRYQTFKDTTFDALQSLRKFFHFHFIDAEGNLDDVQQNIAREFTYQSSLDLSHELFDLIRGIPEAAQLALHARQELVERLEQYEQNQRPLFQNVLRFIEDKMIPIIRTHAISGHTQINSEDELFDDPLALRMMIDVFSERGFHAMVDIHRVDVPERINPETWEITCRVKRVYRFEIRYQASEIRRGQ
ncbi:nucleoside monophosphate kinase [Anatilimnocola sp. NA78]|uniref:nucleoside monophosphate kinase n=1 Tax=Anatilimnocola sp. NA78 TaxID=3415683 RepID=UPI003CE58510